MRTFKQSITEGKVTPALVKGWGSCSETNSPRKLNLAKHLRISVKLDALLDAQGIIGSIGIMNIGMKTEGSP